MWPIDIDHHQKPMRSSTQINTSASFFMVLSCSCQGFIQKKAAHLSERGF
jgi:hypothetical protein